MSEHVLAGIVGGLAGTVAMTIPMMLMMRDQPGAPAIMASRLNGRPPEENTMIGMVIHVVYGILVGLLFTVLLVAFTDPLATYGTLELTLWGLGWGAVLWLGSFFWMFVLGMVEQMREMGGGQRAMMISGTFVFHLIYGGVLGLVAALMP